jgi:hypothetical protein
VTNLIVTVASDSSIFPEVALMMLSKDEEYRTGNKKLDANCKRGVYSRVHLKLLGKSTKPPIRKANISFEVGPQDLNNYKPPQNCGP